MKTESGTWGRKGKLAALCRGAATVLVLALTARAEAALFTTTFPITGTAVNSTNVIGAGSSAATAVNFTNGEQIALTGNPGSTIDAGQYNDRITMYLDNSGNLRLIDNATGAGAGSFSVGDAFGVSGAVELGGEKYCVVAGTSSGVRALKLADGSLTTLGNLTNYNLTSARGLDVFLRPGGSTLNDLAVGILRNPSAQNNVLALYSQGQELMQYNSSFINAEYDGNMGDCSFNLTANSVIFGTDQGVLFDGSFDFSAYPVAPPTVSLSWSNGTVTVQWTGRTLSASTDLTNWTAVATAPASPTQIFPPPPYVEPATNAARFLRARW